MFHQSFDISDIPRIAALAFIEIILSADNAIVLGVLVHWLPKELRKKALYIGLASAFILRAITLLFASLILKSEWLEILGGAYLVYLGIHHFIRKKKGKAVSPTVGSFWKTVIMIEVMDLVFAIDSIIAGVAFIAGVGGTIPDPSAPIHPKLWIVYLGGMLGVIGIRYSADLFSKLIETFPGLEKNAYLLIVWIGLKLCVEIFAPHIPGFEIFFWVVFTALLALGFRRKKLQ